MHLDADGESRVARTSPRTVVPPDVWENVRTVLEVGPLDDYRDGGPFARRLEELFAARLGSGHVLTMNSGTAALHGALVGLGIGPGDEVIVDPLMRFGAVATLHAGARPVFADIEPDTFLISPSSVQRLVTARTKAIIATALFGLLPDLQALRQIAATHGLVLVEDCAQALFAERDGALSCTQGDAGIFSFQASKHLKLGEGGLLVTRTLEARQRAQALREHGWRRDDDPRNVSLGWMYRMPEICAAIGVGTFSACDDILAWHAEVGVMLTVAAEPFAWIVPQVIPAGARHSMWTCAFRVIDPTRRDRLWEALARTDSRFETGHGRGQTMNRRAVFCRSSPTVGVDGGTGASEGTPIACPVAEVVAPEILHIRIDRRLGTHAYEREAACLRRLASAIDWNFHPGLSAASPSPPSAARRPHPAANDH